VQYSDYHFLDLASNSVETFSCISCELVHDCVRRRFLYGSVILGIRIRGLVACFSVWSLAALNGLIGDLGLWCRVREQGRGSEW
jgi:hypothetical protein